MITKIATIPEIDEYGFQRVLPFSRGGDGLEKYAASLPDGVQRYIDRYFKKVDGQHGVLVTAMSASEYWSSNCLPAGSPVRTPHGDVPIEAVRTGDLVLTHRNRYRPVLGTMANPNKAGLVDLWLTGLPKLSPVLSATAGHELWIVTGEEMAKKCGSHFCFVNDLVKKRRPVEERRAGMVDALEFSWRPIGELKKGDYVSEPFPTEEANDLGSDWGNSDVAMLAGLYAAEGCVFRRYDRRRPDSYAKDLAGVVLVLGRHEKKLISEAVQAAERLGHRVTLQYVGSVARLQICWGRFAELCAEHIGTDSLTKKLSPAVLRMSRSWQAVFFRAYRRGAGCAINAKKGKGSIRCVSASVDLLRGMRLLLARLGVVGSISGRHDTKSNWYSGNPIYEMLVGGAQLGHQGRPESYIHPKGFILTKVARVVHRQWEGVVYNLHVAEDNSYTACSISLHNSNGDWFFKKSLVHVPAGWTDDPETDKVLAKGWPYGYPTFYNAFPYAHHCFPAGTQVLMADRTRWQIETVVEGDQVITSQGPKPVTRVFRRRYDGKGFSFRIQGEPDPLVCTEDHPILVYRRDQVHCRCGHDRRGASDHGANCRDFREPIGMPSWVPASSILPGDYVVVPRPPSGEEEVAPEFAELVGWLASEGCYPDLRSGLLQFTLSEDNEADIRAATACLEANGLSVGVKPVPQHGLIHLSACSIELAGRLRDYVVGTRSLKRLTPAVLRWNDDAKLRMLGTYADGDGHVSRNRKNLGQLRIRSSSPMMRRMLADVIRSLGVPCTIQEDAAPREMVSPANGRTYWTNGSGTVAVSPYHAPLVTKYSRKHAVKEGGSRYQHGPLHEGFLVRVLDREEIELHEDVYNLEVAGPHDYVAGEVLVHNCNKDPAKAIGSLDYVTWDDVMNWVLTVVLVDEKKAMRYNGAWILDRLGSGRPVPWSMGCFVPGTPITLADGRTTQVEAVGVGDRLLNARGELTSVTELHRRPYEGQLVRVTPYGEDTIRTTEEHPFLVLRRSDVRGRDAKAIYFSAEKIAAARPEWVVASELRTGDFLVCPFNTDVATPDYMTPAWARLIGYYLAEGHLLRNRANETVGIELTVGDGDTVLKEIHSLCASVGTRNPPFVAPRRNSKHAFSVSIFDRRLAELCEEHAGCLAEEKTLSASAMLWHPDLQLQLLGAFTSGGCQVHRKTRQGGKTGIRYAPGSIYLSTASRQLAGQLRHLAARCGILTGLNVITHHPGPKSLSRKVTTEYRLYVGKNHVNKLVGAADVLSSDPKGDPSRRKLLPNGWVITPIVSVEREPLIYVGDVFNLEVDRGASYVAGNVSVHNCRVPFDLSSLTPDWDLYEKAWASYDPKIHKSPAEAILAFHDKVKKIRGLSRTRKEYPDELLYHMNEINPDGTKAYAINDFPMCFDLSGVGVPADQVAWSIMKLGASRCELSGVKCAGKCRGGGPCRKFVVPGALVWDRLEAHMAKEAGVRIASLGKGGAVRKAADIDKDVVPPVAGSNKIEDVEEARSESAKDLPKDLLDRMGSSFDLPTALSTPSFMGMVLKPREFRRIVMIHIGKKDLADKLDDAGADMPFSFRSDRPEGLGPESFNDELARLLEPFLGERSCLGPVIHRTRIIVIKAHPVGEKSKTVDAEPEIQEKVSALYNGYRQDILEKMAMGARYAINPRPWLRKALYGFTSLDKLGSLTGSLVPLVTERTMEYLRSV